ncbi:MAG: glycosyltransferase [Deltaproteobacteria bacterium]|nr:MAG: glycosyltransferase [Deltaproteobacteria bacterium]
MPALLVIIPDRLSDLAAKGEITARYYNPGDLFDEVHIVMTNGDRPDPGPLAKTVGRARLYVHNLPLPSFVFTLGWQPWLLKNWVQAGVNLAAKIRPALIRTHGNYGNGYLAAQIKKRLGVPLVVSLHTNPDVSQRRATPWRANWKRRLALEAMIKFEIETLKTADWVLPVYEPIHGYALRRGARRVEVCYNVINPDFLRAKESYSLHRPPRIISVSRQIPGKNPENLIRAVARLPEPELTLVGNGEGHAHLREVARECGLANRVIFRPSVPNDELCPLLPDFDIFAAHSDYWEISKSLLEPLLTGLPVVLNRRNGEPVPELQGDFLMLVDNTPEGYYEALQRLLTDDRFREELGRRAYAHAQARWSPAVTEAKYVEIYQRLLTR